MSWQPSQTLGETAYRGVCQGQPRTADAFKVFDVIHTFKRGGCGVSAYSFAEGEQMLVQKLRLIDEAARGGPNICTAAAATRVPSVGALDLALVVDSSQLTGEGQVVCTAAVSGQRFDAQIVYAWTVDGQVQAGVTGNELQLDRVTAGTHQVTVQARDTKNALTSPLRSESFTRAQGTPSGPLTAGGLPTRTPVVDATRPTQLPKSASASQSSANSSASGSGEVPPTVVGGALAVAGAVVILILTRLRRRSVPVPTPGVQPNAPPSPRGPRPTTQPEQPVGRLQPTSRPEPRTPALDPLAGIGNQTLGAAMVVPTRQPAEPTPASRGRRATNPRLRVAVRVSPSQRTRARYAPSDVHIWGDGVDLVFAEYQLTVSPASWEVVDIQEASFQPLRPNGPRPNPFQAIHITDEFNGDNAEQTTLSEFFDPNMRHFFEDDQTELLTAQPVDPVASTLPRTSTQVVIQAKWSQYDHDLQIKATLLSVTVRNKLTDETQQFYNRNASTTIRVVGANPRLTFQVDDEADYDQVFYAVPDDAELAFADGTYWLHVDPQLSLFGQPYAGGLTLLQNSIQRQVDVPNSNRLALQDYFEVTVDTFPATVKAGGVDQPVSSLMRRQGFTLRCLFHLNDALAQKLPGGNYPVSCNVAPTAHGLGESDLVTTFDWMAAKHYRACGQKLADGVPARNVVPMNVHLLPSTIEVGQPVPDELPTQAAGILVWTSRLTATVVSARGDSHLVAGWPVIVETSASGVGGVDPDVFHHHWYFEFSYLPPTEPERQRLDPSCKPYRMYAAAFNSDRSEYGVDSAGRVLFSSEQQTTPTEWCDYDHWAAFYNEADQYLGGQTCTVEAVFHAGEVTYPPRHIKIGDSRRTSELEVADGFNAMFALLASGERQTFAQQRGQITPLYKWEGERIGAAADGVSLLLLRMKVLTAGHATFSLEGAEPVGSLHAMGPNPWAQAGTSTLDVASVPTPDLVRWQEVDHLVYRQGYSGSAIHDPTGNWVFALYKPPRDFGARYTARQFNVKVAFTPADGSRNRTWQAPLRLVRPPLIFVHGTYDNPRDCWQKPLQSSVDPYTTTMAGFFTQLGVLEISDPKWTGCGAFSMLDWESTSGTIDPSGFGPPYYCNATTVWNNPSGIAQVLDIYRGQGIAATQVDLVCHSQGGLIARVYARGVSLSETPPPAHLAMDPDHLLLKAPYRCGIDQVCWFHRADNFYRGDIHKLVTLSTTHMGSDLSRLLDQYVRYRKASWRVTAVALWTGVFLAVVSAKNAVYTQAFKDQVPGSDALKMIGATVVPSHAIACVADDDDLPTVDNGFYQDRMTDVWMKTPDDVRTWVFEQLGQPNDAERLAQNAAEGGYPNYVPPPSVLAWHLAALRAAVFGHRRNDCTVRLESSLGGLRRDQTSTVLEHVLHGYAPRYREVQQEVLRLLDAPVEGGDLCLSGFPDAFASNGAWDTEAQLGNDAVDAGSPRAPGSNE